MGEGVFLVQEQVVAVVYYFSQVRYFLVVQLVAANFCERDRAGRSAG